MRHKVPIVMGRQKKWMERNFTSSMLFIYLFIYLFSFIRKNAREKGEKQKGSQIYRYIDIY